jgi:hypothetical protein
MSLKFSEYIIDYSIIYSASKDFQNYTTFHQQHTEQLIDAKSAAAVKEEKYGTN